MYHSILVAILQRGGFPLLAPGIIVKTYLEFEGYCRESGEVCPVADVVPLPAPRTSLLG